MASRRAARRGLRAIVHLAIAASRRTRTRAPWSDVPGYFRNVLVNTVLASGVTPMHFRGRLLAYTGIESRGAKVDAECYINGRHVTIGPGAYIGRRVHIDASEAAVRIGAGVAVAAHARFLTTGHEFGPSEWRAGAAVHLPIEVGDGCWIGAGATILPGVTVASGCMVAAGAVVVTNTEPDGLYGGVPARRIRDL